MSGHTKFGSKIKIYSLDRAVQIPHTHFILGGGGGEIIFIRGGSFAWGAYFCFINGGPVSELASCSSRMVL